MSPLFQVSSARALPCRPAAHNRVRRKRNLLAGAPEACPSVPTPTPPGLRLRTAAPPKAGTGRAHHPTPRGPPPSRMALSPPSRPGARPSTTPSPAQLSLCRLPPNSSELYPKEACRPRKPSADTSELQRRWDPDHRPSSHPGPREGRKFSISLTMRPPRSAPVPGLIVGLRLLGRRPLPLHIPTRRALSGWRSQGPKGKGYPALRGGTSGARKLTSFPVFQSG